MIHVAFASDEAYLPHCAAAIHSVLVANEKVTVHLLCDQKISPEKIVILRTFVESCGGDFCVHGVPEEWIEGLPRLRRISEVMWYRVFLPDILKDMDRILYLDCDTIVRSDLSDLWKTDFGGSYLAAVANVMEPEAEHWPSKLGIGSLVYFNSGVLLMNLTAMRKDGVGAKIISYGRKEAKRLRWPDQDALNVHLGPGRKELHPRWNCQNSFFYYSWSKNYFDEVALNEAITAPAILHFEGGEVVKPWHYLSKHPFRSAYLEHREKTPWPLTEYDGKTFKSVLLRPLPAKAIFGLLKIRSGIAKKLNRARH